MKPASLLSWHSKYSKVIQLRISLGIPMISLRDAIVLGSGYHLPDRNAFLIHTKTILEDTCRHCAIPKPEKGVVRMATESIFYVQLVKADVISFKMIGRDDLKLKYMPSSVLNYLSQGHLPFDLMKTVYKVRNEERQLVHGDSPSNKLTMSSQSRGFATSRVHLGMNKLRRGAHTTRRLRTKLMIS